MSKITAYFRGEQGPSGYTYLPTFEVDIEDGQLYVYKHNDGSNFELDDDGNLNLIITRDVNYYGDF